MSRISARRWVRVGPPMKDPCKTESPMIVTAPWVRGVGSNDELANAASAGAGPTVDTAPPTSDTDSAAARNGCRNRDRRIVGHLLDAGADINATGRSWAVDDSSALYASVVWLHPDVARLLVERGAQLGGATTTGGVSFPGLFDAWGKQVIAGIVMVFSNLEGPAAVLAVQDE